MAQSFDKRKYKLYGENIGNLPEVAATSERPQRPMLFPKCSICVVPVMRPMSIQRGKRIGKICCLFYHDSLLRGCRDLGSFPTFLARTWWVSRGEINCPVVYNFLHPSVTWSSAYPLSLYDTVSWGRGTAQTAAMAIVEIIAMRNSRIGWGCIGYSSIQHKSISNGFAHGHWQESDCDLFEENRKTKAVYWCPVFVCVFVEHL